MYLIYNAFCFSLPPTKNFILYFRIMPNSQIGPSAPVVPGTIPAMQQHQVRMAAQINPRMPMNHPAMMNSHPQMHPAMMNAMGTPNMTIPPNHHVSATQTYGCLRQTLAALLPQCCFPLFL